jgi:hypothetical protein
MVGHEPICDPWGNITSSQIGFSSFPTFRFRSLVSHIIEFK